MATDGVVKAAGVRKMSVENRWNVDNWGTPRGFLLDVTERGANAAKAFPAPHPQVVHLPLTPRGRHVTVADLRRYGVIPCRPQRKPTGVFDFHKEFLQRINWSRQKIPEFR